mgnify:CR=1 FL=1
MPSFSRPLEETLHRAVHYANERRHEYATLEHLLLALIDDPDASAVMTACNVDLGALERLNVRLSSAASSTIRARWRSRYSVLVERAKPSSSARPASVNTIGVASEMPLIHPLNHDSPSSESGTSRGGSARGRIRLARLEGLEARCQLSGCRSVSWPMLAKLLASMAISASSRAFAERMRMPKPRP